MHCIDHGCKDHKKYAECCNKLLLLYSFTFLLGTIVITAIVRAATVVATAVSNVAVLVIVVIALDVRIIAEIVRKILVIIGDILSCKYSKKLLDRRNYDLPVDVFGFSQTVDLI